MALPKELLQQIEGAWKKIDTSIDIVFKASSSARGSTAYGQALELVEATAPLNEKIVYRQEEVEGEGFEIALSRSGEEPSIVFEGAPLGHELTSFVLAPLALSGQARMPDEPTIRRIKALQGKIEVITYVSLTCENCPTVVQAFNTMAAIHPTLRHRMVDGSVAPERMKELGILSVPTVMVNGKSFSTGRQDMSSLLDKLEKEFGASEATIEESHRDYDVVIVGGGPAGASAAIYTARKGLKTAMVTENVGGQVKETKGIENQISVPYIEGPQLAEKLREHVESYPIDIIENQKVEAMVVDTKKHLNLKGGLRLHSSVVIAATGARWRELNVPGEKEYLGRGVAFCPHCDGPFYKGRDIAVVGGGNSGVEAALDLAGICSSVTIIEYSDTIRADQILLDKVEAKDNISVITEAQTLAIEGDEERVTGLRYLNRATQEESTIALAGVFIQIGLIPNSSWIADHLKTTRHGEIEINERNETSTPGLFAAGDVTTVPYKQIVVAMGEGAKAGLSSFEYLLKAE